ncbi:uncharacterized protein LOC117182587 [Belonocnema kinseyi]|uniref:uncharacterized protein LOC117182587 n=1 Tax=Belonocnema kinseyi TaxID=2817044 RepID=UPI00143D2F56|nr:uncharacterized protein LOC117182587 [Belonocnema kinseyi]
MHPTVLVEVGKLNPPPRVEAANEDGSSNRFHIHGCASGLHFLVDTGAEISLILVTNPMAKPAALKLFAANDTIIKTYAVANPIIGANLLDHYGIVVDIRRRKLIDPADKSSPDGCFKPCDIASFSVLDRSCRFSEIVAQHPEDSSSKPGKPITSQDVSHHIETSGPPVTERSRGLDPEKYKVVQAEFDELVKQDICRQSKSPWASLIHMVRKKDA